MQASMNEYYNSASSFVNQCTDHASKLAQDCIDSMPNNTLECAKRGALVSAAFSAVFSGYAISAIVVGAAVSATASLVDSAVNPIFKEYLADNGRYSAVALSAKQVVVYTIVCAAAVAVSAPVGSMAISIACLSTIFNILHTPHNGYDADSSSSYLFGAI